MAKKQFENTYEVILQEGTLKIYINNLIHVSLSQEELVGFKTWFEGKRTGRRYYIEYYLNQTTMLLEYDCFDRWSTLLRKLDQLNLF